MADDMTEVRLGGKAYRMRATTAFTDEIASDPPDPPSDEERAAFALWLDFRVCKCGACFALVKRECPKCGAAQLRHGGL